MTVGERIKARRIELGMSQAELAEKVGYKEKATISKIESDGRSLRQSKIILFAKALETTPLYLLTGDGDKESPDAQYEKYSEFIDYIKEMTEAEQNELKRFMQFIIDRDR